MSALALGLVLLAAFMHATWNAIIKGSGDRVTAMGAVTLGHGILGGVGVLFLPPPAVESWPYLFASTLIHYAYYGFLILSYRLGDLSQVYPIARGVAPVLVALGAQHFAGEILPPGAWAGILAVSFGVVMLSLGGLGANPRASLAALGTGAVIAAYSVVDGLGVRLAGEPLSYIFWLFLLEAPLPVIILALYRWPSLREAAPGLAGGFISGAAYGLVLYAKTFSALGTVSAVRESSAVIAALIGVIWLGERPWRARLVAACVVTSGVVILTLAI